jgi:nucleotide-binding universal stress UspA family protein
MSSRRDTSGAMRVLLAVDGSPSSKHAVESVAKRAWPPGTDFRVLSVFQAPLPSNAAGGGIPAEFRRKYEAALSRSAHTAASGAAAALQRRGLTVHTRVVEGNSGRTIVDEAHRWRADLIVVGSRGLSRVSRALLGSVATYVAANASTSVEIIRKRKR